MKRQNEFQDLEWARPLIVARIRENKRAGDGTSLSGLFTMLRRHPRLTLIGDYFLFWIIIDEIKRIDNLKNALHKSAEYKEISKAEKMRWFRDLVASISEVQQMHRNK